MIFKDELDFLKDLYGVEKTIEMFEEAKPKLEYSIDPSKIIILGTAGEINNE